mmetsp:Transcript_19727/g.56729  ORF Transcript_19727/g.56729 Transcript_19727/m.56729 type:complete len:274 (+) Transcript_19727:396-1217(+)
MEATRVDSRSKIPAVLAMALRSTCDLREDVARANQSRKQTNSRTGPYPSRSDVDVELHKSLVIDASLRADDAPVPPSRADISPTRLVAAADGDVEDGREDEGLKARLCSKMRLRRTIRPEANAHPSCCGTPYFSTTRANGRTNLLRTMSVSVTAAVLLPVSDCNFRWRRTKTGRRVGESSRLRSGETSTRTAAASCCCCRRRWSKLPSKFSTKRSYRLRTDGVSVDPPRSLLRVIGSSPTHTCMLPVLFSATTDSDTCTCTRDTLHVQDRNRR